MNSNKFEYFLNAVHYSLWLSDMRFGDFMGRIVNIVLSPIPKHLFTKEYRKKYYERLSKQQKDIDKFFYDKETGYHIGWANHWFGYFYSCYPGFLSFILLGFAYKFLGNLHYLVIIFISAIPIGLCYIPAYKAVFTNDRYLKYFKQFEKEDEQWHKKWKRITIAFCVGAVVVALLSIGVMWCILSLTERHVD